MGKNSRSAKILRDCKMVEVEPPADPCAGLKSDDPVNGTTHSPDRVTYLNLSSRASELSHLTPTAGVHGLVTLHPISCSRCRGEP